MSKYAIEINQVSKQYRLGNVGSKSFGQDMQRWWAKVKGKEDPFLKLGETNDRSKSGISDFVWALKAIDFKVPQGEVLGIIGKNGAGKSTLLKLLSRVTAPTTGSIVARGRMASLLEVGTGFHPELTGRENIFLNGAILGMTKVEIKAKLDEIIDFSGVERYIDTPVKRYSSGMYVRLAFAVAAHLEPEILVVDEVLAVGDADFQKKAIGKMKEVSAGGGRTVLFVSHNMTSVKNLCTAGIVLENGLHTFSGTAEESVNYYLSGNHTSLWSRTFSKNEVANEYAFIKKIQIKTTEEVLTTHSSFSVGVTYQQKKVGDVTICMVFCDEYGQKLFSTMNNSNNPFYQTQKTNTEEEYYSQLHIPGDLLNNKKYFITLILNGPGYNHVHHRFFEQALVLDVFDHPHLKGDFMRNYDGFVRPSLNWETRANHE
ncbi:MAG: lipopolysaccharide transport system ATP-binding protein [Flavobacteriales bacterium]|jgi:lipopolysaccharide transport system ATP-binding protein